MSACDTAGSLTPRTSAAARTEPSRATSTKALSWVSVTAPTTALRTHLTLNQMLIGRLSSVWPSGTLRTCRFPPRSSTSGPPASSTRWQLLARCGPEARVVAGGHSLHPDDEAAAGPPGGPDRHQRPHRAGLHPADGDELCIGALTRHARAARLAGRRRALPDLPRRGAGHRRPDRAQPGHRRRLAVPGRPVRGPLRGVRRGQRGRGDPRVRTATRRCRSASSTSGRTRPSSPPASCWSSRCIRHPDPRRAAGISAAARTRRWNAGSATGRWPRPGRRSGWTARRSRTPASG